jgi:hypothetical protein
VDAYRASNSRVRGALYVQDGKMLAKMRHSLIFVFVAFPDPENQDKGYWIC